MTLLNILSLFGKERKRGLPVSAARGGRCVYLKKEGAASGSLVPKMLLETGNKSQGREKMMGRQS